MSEMIYFPQTTPLANELRHIITVEGAMPFERYMALCLGHPRFGYYMTRDPFGVNGDFTTSPEISQMFGELVGLWVADVWQNMGSPLSFNLIELGPGRGTLMKDVLRSLKSLKGCLQAARVHLVEMSSVLQVIQVETLKDHPVSWHQTIETLPDGLPNIIIANEFFDALPVRQYIRVKDHWHERTVALDPHGALHMSYAHAPEIIIEKRGEEGDILEVAPQAVSCMATLAERIRDDGGAFLCFDYGYVSGVNGDTVQALKAHQPIDVLACPGQADVTAHVNFSALKVAAQRFGCVVHGPITQGDFLTNLGLNIRAAMLKKRATTEQSYAIDLAVERFLDHNDKGMGQLFKVMVVANPNVQEVIGI